MSDPVFSPEQLLLEANIREFGHTISLICALEAGGKISSSEAFALIKKTWNELKASRKSLMNRDSDESL